MHRTHKIREPQHFLFIMFQTCWLAERYKQGFSGSEGYIYMSKLVKDRMLWYAIWNKQDFVEPGAKCTCKVNEGCAKKDVYKSYI